MLDRFGDKIRSYDLYGQPINLNYLGEDSYKTIPGGLLSIVFKIVFLAYIVLKGKQMI